MTRYSDTQLIVTVSAIPKGVIVSGEACMSFVGGVEERRTYC